jgi:hypothetical protein
MPGGYNWATLFLEDINAGTWPGILKIEKIKCDHESRWIETRERLRWRGPATTENYNLLREGAPCQQNHKCLKMILKKRKNLFAGPRWVPNTKTDWPTDRRS